MHVLLAARFFSPPQKELRNAFQYPLRSILEHLGTSTEPMEVVHAALRGVRAALMVPCLLLTSMSARRTIAHVNRARGIGCPIPSTDLPQLPRTVGPLGPLTIRFDISAGRGGVLCRNFYESR